MKQYGDFTLDGREFIIKDRSIPRKWENYIWNRSFLCNISHDGTGTSFLKHADGLRTDLVKGQRCIYVRSDHERFRFPGESKNETTIHGIGYTAFRAEESGIEASLVISVPRNIKGEAWKISLKNKCNEKKNYTIFAYIPIDLTGYPTSFGYKWSMKTSFEKELNGLLYENDDPCRTAEYFNGYICSDTKITGFDMVEANFIGEGRSLDNPLAVAIGKCTSVLFGGGDTTIGVLQFDTQLEPFSERDIQIIIGLFEKKAEVIQAVNEYLPEGALDRELQRYSKEMDNYMDNIVIETNDKKLNRLFNIWAKNNLSMVARWTRIYSRGFRDTLQDSAGIVTLDAAIARENIIEAMAYVYKSGRCRRAWANVSTALSDEFYTDGPVWIPLAVNAYIRETGDTGILDMECPWYDGGQGTVFEHMLTALRFLYNDRGNHGLCRIHDGDWCDTAHLLGKKGIGEGIWLSIALFNALNEVMELADFLGDHDLKHEMYLMSEEIREKVNENGWDGDWFLIAYNDDEKKIGSKDNREGKIFLNPQSWAVISNIADKERREKCLESIDKYLDTWVGPVLLAPPYTKQDRGIGAITGFYPGTIENGSCYCHAASFKIVADCKAGRGNKAFETLSKIIPGGDADSNNPIADCPPYAFTNSRIAPGHPYMAGRILSAWTTGTVSWCWQALTEWMMGVRGTFTGLMIDPCIPGDWTSFSMKRRFRGSTYKIDVINPDHIQKGVKAIWLDGKQLDGNILPVTTGKIHVVKVIMG